MAFPTNVPHRSRHGMRIASRLVRVLAVALLIVGVVAGIAAAQGADGAWSSPFDHPGTSRRNNAVHDPLHARMIVFGGSGRSFDQIWTLSLGDRPEWSSHRVNGTVPRHRMGASAIFDPVRDRVIMFEGSELWALSLTETPTWTMLQAAGAAPPPRAWHSAVYDSKRDRMIVFGGREGGAYLGDVWALDLANGPTWEQVAAPSRGPVPRWMHAATYDEVHDRMLVAVGEGASGWLSDSWELALSGEGDWRQISSTGPPGRVGASLLYDPVHDQAVLLGGWGTLVHNYYMTPWTDVWTLSAETGQWSQVGSFPWLAGVNEYTYGAPAIFDLARRRIVAYGGTDPMMIPSLEFNGPGPAPSRFSFLLPRPWPRYGQSVVYDPKRERMIMALGSTQDGWIDQTWELPLNGNPMWSGLPTGGEYEREYQTAIHDPLRDRLIFFGGWGSNETWELPLASPAWKRLSPGGTVPEFREGHSAIRDPRRDQMIVFGGVGHTDSRTDAFALSLDRMVWSPLPPGPSLAWHNAIYDPVGDRMLVFGGATDRYYAPTNEVWSLTLEDPTWTQLTPEGEAPPARTMSAAVYDPIRHRLVVYGGCCYDDEDGYTFAFGDTWELALDGTLRWRRMNGPGSPQARRSANLVYDPPRDRAILSGGLPGDEWFPTHDDIWALTWGNPVRPAVSNPGDIVSGTPVVLSYVLSNPLPGPRAIEWTLSSEHDWPGFPRRGVQVVPGGGSETVRLELALPEASLAAPNGLTFAAEYSGAPGHVSVVRHLVQGRPVVTSLAIRVLGSIGSAGARPRVEFALRDASPARLELLDVAGRRLLARDVGSLGPGTHVLDLTEHLTLGSGIYFVRLRQAGDEVHTRAAVIR